MINQTTLPPIKLRDATRVERAHALERGLAALKQLVSDIKDDISNLEGVLHIAESLSDSNLDTPNEKIA